VSICVSAIDPDELVPCVAAGADMVELGNFDMFYDQVHISIKQQDETSLWTVNEHVALPSRL
jgi:Protein of unknown function (DUF561)